MGAVQVWVALGMLGVQACSMSGSILHRLRFKGIHGAFGLGLAYGILSGSCTFGFIGPILAIVTIQQKIVAGLIMMLLFALGHCIPIVVAGSSTAMVRRITESSSWQGAGLWFRRGAGVMIALLGIYFIVNPFSIRKVKARSGEFIRYETNEKNVDGQNRYIIRVENMRAEAGRYVDTLLVLTDSTVRPTIPVYVLGIIK